MDMIFEVFTDFLSIRILLIVLIGVAAGILGGSLPGVSPSMTISLLLPITLKMDIVSAMALLMASYATINPLATFTSGQSCALL